MGYFVYFTLNVEFLEIIIYHLYIVMKNKLLLYILILLFLFSVMLLFVFILRNQKTERTTVEDGGAGETVVQDIPTNQYEISMNQNVSETPQGYSNVTAYFDEMNNKYFSDCQPIDFDGKNPEEMDPLGELNTYLDDDSSRLRSAMNYDSIKASLSYYQGISIETDNGYCTFINIEKDGTKFIYYFNHDGVLQEVKI
jgi:hypothetical protein